MLRSFVKSKNLCSTTYWNGLNAERSDTRTTCDNKVKLAHDVTSRKRRGEGQEGERDGGENEAKDVVKGQNVMCLIWLLWMLWKEKDYKTEPNCHVRPRKVTCSAFETMRKDTKTRQFGNFTKANGQISSSGQLARRNSPHPTTNQHGRITLCLSDPCLYLLLLLGVHRRHGTQAHTHI